MINEESEDNKITASYKKITSIISGNGYSRETGRIYEGNQIWRLNRYSTFKVIPLSGDRFKFELISITSSDDDNVPDPIMKKFRPEQSRPVNLIKIEEVGSGIWLISGLAYPLFACKEN